MCVKTIVFKRPMRRASQGATSCEAALSRPVQKKNAPAAASDSPKRCISHSDTRLLSTRPPAKASTENSAASLTTTGREGPSGAGAAACGSAAEGSGRRRYSVQIANPMTAYSTNIARRASTIAHPARGASQAGRPTARAPNAALSEPARL